MKTLKRLWDLADREAPKMNEEPDYVFHDIGLALFRPLQKNIGYISTPINSSVFADMGGDGVHYCLLHLIGEPSDDSPVVMSVPMNFDDPNLIVGENLLDFLCLGCRAGYIVLEQLVYDRPGTIDWLQQPEKFWASYDLSDKRGQYLLGLLKQEFSLKPWSNIEQRLNELQERYMPLLRLPSENDDL